MKLANRVIESAGLRSSSDRSLVVSSAVVSLSFTIDRSINENGSNYRRTILFGQQIGRCVCVHHSVYYTTCATPSTHAYTLPTLSTYPIGGNLYPSV